MKNAARLFACALVAAIAAPAFAQTPEDIARQVTIRRTEYGVPHILAENERAAGFGMGYVQAEDHCETIMHHIIRARGKLAETFGDVDGNLDSDIRNHQFRVYARAKETYPKLDADWRAMLEGYAMGFSHYVANHRADLPEWVGSIDGIDVAAHGLTGVARFAFNRGRVVDRFLESMNAGEYPVVKPEDMGSNMWAFDGTRTASGKAILMGNPHQPWSKVATYYEGHLTIPGKYNMYGSTFIGRPVFTTGFNDHLGWTHTVNYPDLEEIYELDLDPRNPGKFLLDGRPQSIFVEEAVIGVKGERGRKHEFLYTDLGPVIHHTRSKIYVLRSAAFEEYRFYQQWYRLGQAANFQEFYKALEIGAIPMFNLGYADDRGNIYALWNGTIPKMPHAAHDAVAVHARNSREMWTDFHAIKELPQLLNPKGGYVMNSNSPPYFTNLHEPLRRSSYPAYFPDNSLSLRSQNSLHLIHNNQRFNLEDVVEQKFTMQALLTERVRDDLIRAVEGRQTERVREVEPAPAPEPEREEEDSGISRVIGILQEVDRLLSEPEDEPAPQTEATPAASSDPEVARALDRIRSWDGTVAADSRGSALFQEWWTLYTGDHSIYTDQEEIFAEVWDESNPIETPRGLADPARAVQAFEDAIASMNERFGTWDVAWGDIHRMRTGDKDLPIGGGGHDLGCFRIVLYEQGDDGKYVANSGDSWVFAVEFGDVPTAYTVVAYSQSGNPDSPHYNDQAELYTKHKMKRAAFTERDIRRQLLREYSPPVAPTRQPRGVTGELLDRLRR